MKKALIIMLSVMALVVFIVILLWHYRFNFMKKTNLSYDTNDITKIILYSKNIEYGKYTDIVKYSLETRLEIESFIEELNSLNVIEIDSDDPIIESISYGEPILRVMIYNGNNLIEEIYIKPKYVCIRNLNYDWDVIKNSYIIADNFYKKDGMLPFNKYFYKKES